MKNIWVTDNLGGYWQAIDGVIELSLGDCGDKINNWKKRFFQKKNIKPAIIQLRCLYKAPEPFLWKYFLELLIGGKIQEQHRIREEAYDVLELGKTKSEYPSSSVLFIQYEVFTPQKMPPKEKKAPLPKPSKKPIQSIWDFDDNEPSVLSIL